MNNILKHSELMAFHPGYYVAEIVEDMGITQAEFAMRLGTTPKTVSELINGQINLSNDLAKKLSAMMGSSVEFWLNLQTEYDEKVIEIERQQELEAQIEVAKQIDYPFFVKVANLPETKLITEKIVHLCQYFKVSDLRLLAKPDFLVNFRTGITVVEKKNVINAQAWLQTAMNFANEMKVARFDADRLKEYLPEIRSMTVQSPEVFLPRLREIFSECGIAFVLLPYLKNSGINGAVKWINNERVVLAMNDRRAYADTFWFSLFHEIKHVLQQKVKTVFVSFDKQAMRDIDEKMEEEADNFAQNKLIPQKEYNMFIMNGYVTDAEIVAFAKSINIHAGIVVGRLKHDKIIAPNRCESLRQKYKIIM